MSAVEKSSDIILKLFSRWKSSEIISMKTDTMLDSKKPDRKPLMDFRLALYTLILDDLELAYFKVIKIACQILQKWRQIHREIWPWMTLNRPRSRSEIFTANISNMVTDIMLDFKGCQIAKRQWTWTFDWHHEFWPWMTLNCPSLDNGLKTACIG